MKNNYTTSLILFLSLAFLLSCSEEETPSPSTQQEALTGIFLDSPVEGLYYESESFNGYTDANGQFSYAEGELVTFFVGDIKIGSAIGREEVTPLSVASTPDATVETQEVKNIAAFLQTLDRDGDPANGIEIEQEVVDVLGVETINFEESITQIIGEIVNTVNQETGFDLNPVYPEEAAVHLASSLNTTYEPNDILFTDFIPTIESWNTYARPYSPQTATIWVHETDEEGRPTQSIQYEKYPYRILRKYVYSDYNEFDLPVNMEVKYYYFGEEGGIGYNSLTYNSNGEVSTWVSNGSSLWKRELEKSNQGMIKKVSTIFNNSFNYKDVYEYNNDGNLKSEIRYTDVAESEGSIEFKYFYTYTEFGEIETLFMQYPNSEYSDFTWQYSYDDNNVLTERYRETVDLHGRDRTDTYFYDEEERKERVLIEVGDYVSDYVEFFPNGDAKRAETTYQGFLYEIVTWDEDRYSEWKIIEEETGNYRIEYKDPDENILKTEYYDKDGNLISVNQ